MADEKVESLSPSSRIELTLLQSDATTLQLRKVLFGHRPAVLIEPEIDEGVAVFKIDTVDIADPAELAVILREIAEGLERGVVKEGPHE